MVPSRVERVVSLVPSLTEALAVTASAAGRPGVLVGATHWCTHPPGLAVTRVRGTKNPDLPAVLALRPDLVLANEEENRSVDIDALRGHGVPVWVTAPRTVAAALGSLGRMLDACRLARPQWLADATRVWSVLGPVPARSAVVPIWRRPWMVLGRDTFAGDVLRRLGVGNVFEGHPERYPRVELAQVREQQPSLVVLPDEPYAFGAADLPAFAGWPVDVAFVSGRHLTWYGPSLVEAPRVLAAQLQATLRPPA